MSSKQIYSTANRIHGKILDIGDVKKLPRVLIDAWASLYAWHQSGERVWRITAEQAGRLLDEPLPDAIMLESSPTRGPAVCYELPSRRDWIVLARHAPPPCEIVVFENLRWAYGEPILTYCTELENGTLSSGYFNLRDYPNPSKIQIRPGYGLISGKLTMAEIAEEDYRVSLAIAQHYRP